MVLPHRRMERVTKPNPPRGTRVLKRAHKIALLALLLVAVGAGAWITSARLEGPGPREVALSDAVTQLRTGAVSKAWVDDTAHTVTLESAGGRVVASYPDGYSGDLTRQALAAKVVVEASAPTDGGLVGRLLTNVLPVVLVLALLLYLAKSGSLTGGLGR